MIQARGAEHIANLHKMAFLLAWKKGWMALRASQQSCHTDGAMALLVSCSALSQGCDSFMLRVFLPSLENESCHE